MTISNNVNNSPYRPELEVGSSERKEELVSSQNNMYHYNTINNLPDDILFIIFHFSAGCNQEGHGKTLANIRAVCRLWYHLSEEVLRKYWNELMAKPSFLRDAAIKIDKVAKGSDAALESVEFLSSTSESNDVERIKQGPYFLRFNQLTQNLRAVTRIPEEFVVLGLQPSQYLNAPFDHVLLTIWPKIKKEIQGAPELNEAKQIRQWLKDSENLPKICKVRYLNLSGLELSVLPPEIGKFTRLKKLVLTNNRLTAIPNTICNLTELKYLDLYNNQFKSIPVGTIRKLCGHKLVSVDFSRNPIRQTPSSIDYLILDTDGRTVYRHPCVNF